MSGANLLCNVIRNVSTFHANIYHAMFVGVKYIHFHHFDTVYHSYIACGVWRPTTSPVLTINAFFYFLFCMWLCERFILMCMASMKHLVTLVFHDMDWFKKRFANLHLRVFWNLFWTFILRCLLISVTFTAITLILMWRTRTKLRIDWFFIKSLPCC